MASGSAPMSGLSGPHTGGLLPYYRMDRGIVNIQEVVVPDCRSRELRDVHVAATRENLIRGGGYNISVGQISVCFQEPYDTTEHAVGHLFDFTSDEFKDHHAVLIDGGHRLTALLSLVTDQDTQVGSQWASITERLQVTVWSRHDGAAMTEWDWLHVAAYCNDAASTNAKPTVMDHIFGAIQTANLVAREQHDGSIHSVTSEEVREAIETTKTIGRGSTMAARYARVAVRLAKSEAAHAVVKATFTNTSEKLGLVHIMSHDLLNLNDEEFSFCLSALGERLNAGTPGRFDEISASFFRSATAMHTELSLIAEANNTTVEGLASVNIDVAQQATMPLPQYAAARLAKAEFPKAHDPIKDRRRAQDLMRKLSKSTNLTIPIKQLPKSRGGKTAAPEPDAGAGGATEDGASETRTRGGAAQADAARKNATGRGKRSRNPPKRLAEDEIQPATPNKRSRRGRTTRKKVVVDSDSEFESDGNDGGNGRRGGSKGGAKKTGGKTKLTYKAATRSKGSSADMYFPPTTGEARAGEADETARFDDELPDALPLETEDPPSIPNMTDEQLIMAEANVVLKLLEPLGTIVLDSFNPRLLLRCMSIPMEHRSHLFMQSSPDIARMMVRMFMRIGVNGLATMTQDHRDALLMKCQTFCGVGPAPNGGEAHMDGAQMRMAQEYPIVCTTPAVADKHLGVLHGELMHVGYCILEGVLNEEAVPSTIFTNRIVPGVTVDNLDFNAEVAISSQNAPASLKLFDPERDVRFNRQMQAMITHLEENFPTLDERKNGKRTEEWFSINNEWSSKEDEDAAFDGRTRYMTDRAYLMDVMEQDRDQVEFTKIRASLDTRMAMGLHLILRGTPGDRLGDVWIPRSGGRFLATVRGAGRQKAHTDTHTREAEAIRSDDGTPGFFAMATGAAEAEVFIVKHAHRIHNLVWAAGDDRGRGLQSTMRAERVVIPPFSIIYVRGDTVHFGAGWDDHKVSAPKGVLIRYHLYFVPRDLPLGDAIYETRFKPQVWDDVWEKEDREEADGGSVGGGDEGSDGGSDDEEEDSDSEDDDDGGDDAGGKTSGRSDRDGSDDEGGEGSARTGGSSGRGGRSGGSVRSLVMVSETPEE